MSKFVILQRIYHNDWTIFIKASLDTDSFLTFPWFLHDLYSVTFIQQTTPAVDLYLITIFIQP